MAEIIGVGRLVPASEIEFSRCAKNLAWLLECSLSLARETLARCYGFGSAYELKQAIPAPGDKVTPTGPFTCPRARPEFYADFTKPRDFSSPNRLQGLFGRERRLVEIVLACLEARDDALTPAQAAIHSGRLRRRHYAVLDAGFFSAPAVHRKAFAGVKAGILALEGSHEEAERYLEQHWPPGYWPFLESMFLTDFDPRAGLAELKDQSLYFSPDEILKLAEIHRRTAVHRTAEVFLAMAGRGVESAYELRDDPVGPDQLEPEVRRGNCGLTGENWSDSWWYVQTKLIERFAPSPEWVSQLKEVQSLAQLLTAPPPNTPPELLAAARAWRLMELRTYCLAHLKSRHTQKAWSLAGELLSLRVEIELVEPPQQSSLKTCYRAFQFKALLIQTREDADDLVGYMAGWLLQLDDGEFVADASELLQEAQDQLLRDGLSGFTASFLPFSGQSELEFNNSNYANGVAITEIVLREKYRNQGLGQIALECFVDTIEAGGASEFPYNWPHLADFKISSLAAESVEIDDLPSSFDAAPPGVFLIPADQPQRKLKTSLLAMGFRTESFDELVEVFPFQPTLR